MAVNIPSLRAQLKDDIVFAAITLSDVRYLIVVRIAPVQLLATSL